MSAARARRSAGTGGRTSIFALLAGVLVAAVACTLAGAFLSWLVIPTLTGGATRVSGIGSVSGDSQLAGENLNDVLTGLGSFRPGWVTLSIALALLLTGAATVLAGSRRRAALRLGGGLVAVLAALGTWWSIRRMLDPDPAALLGGGTASGGAGQILTLIGMALALLGAGMLLFGLLDPRDSERPSHRGIQPSR
ncbi:MAG: hypothetical protein WKF57_22115 [Nakamurella sp.]